MGYPTQQQKVDYLFKKIGFTKTKTGVAEDQTSGFSGDTKKAPPNEAIASPLIIPSSTIWSDSGFITATPPTSNTAYVGVYTTATAYRMTVDTTVANERTFIARQTWGNPSSAIDGDWIDTQFGADYLVKVYMGDPSTGVPGVAYTNLSAAGTSGKDDVWFFDYSSGVLNFNGADLDGQLVGIHTDNVYLVGYRYIGRKGVQPAAGLGTFHDLVVSNNLSVGGISTLTGQVGFGTHITLPDHAKLKVGTHEDIEIYNKGNLSIIANKASGANSNNNPLHIHSFYDLHQSSTFSQYFKVGNSSGAEVHSGGDSALTLRSGGAVETYYNGEKRFETTGVGATIFGTTQTQQLNVSGVSTFSGLIDANGIIEGVAGQNKIPSLYNAFSDLPNAGTYHGLFAHVHEHGRGYFAHGGAWYELVNKESNGVVGTGTESYNIGSLVISGVTTSGNIGISTGVITGPSVTYIDPATVGDDTGTLVIKGDLQVEGTQTVVNSSTMTVTDKNIELAKGAANDAAADGGGITVDSGDGDKTWQWVDATDSWTSSEHIRIPDNKVFGFASDTNTFISRPSADTIAFTTGGNQRVSINSNGNVIIGTTAWNYEKPLNVQGSSGSILSLYNGDTTTYAANTFVGIELKLRTGNTGATNASCEIRASKENGTNGDSARALSFYTGINGGSPTERIRITSDGKFGIGTDSPEEVLHIQAASPVIKFSDGSLDSYIKGDASDLKFIVGGTSRDFKFQSSILSTSEVARITGDGKVGIGTDAPKETLEVFSGSAGRPTFRHTGGYGGLQIAGPQPASGASLMFTRSYDTVGGGSTVYSLLMAGNTQGLHFVSGDPSEASTKTRLFLNSTGSVGINTSNPRQKFHLDNGVMFIRGDTAPSIRINAAINDTSSTRFVFGLATGANNFFNGAQTLDGCVTAPSTGRLLLGVGVSPRMYIVNSGDITIARPTQLGNAKLSVQCDSGSEEGIAVNLNQNSGISTAFAIWNTGGEIFNLAQYTDSTPDLVFKIKNSGESAPVEKVRFTSDGKVGIGTDNPTQKVQINNGADDPNIVLLYGADTSTEYAGIGVFQGNATFTGGGIGGTNAGISLRTADGGTETERVRITSDGKVGINSSSPTSKLDVVGDVKISGISTFSNTVKIGTGVTALTDGNVSIGGTFEIFESSGIANRNFSQFKLSNFSISQFQNTGSYLVKNSSTGQLLLGGGTGGNGGISLYNNSLGAKYLRTFSEGSVQIYYDNALRFETSGIGATVYGQLDTTTLNTGNATFTGTISAGSTTGTDGYYLKTTGVGVTWAQFPTARNSQVFTATAGQTTFSFTYNVNYLDVFVNGVKLPASEFTASNGTSVVLDDGCFVNDTVELITYNTVPSSSSGAQSLNQLNDITITGSPVIGETLQHNGSAFVNDYTVSATTTSTSQTAILSLPVATYRSVEYTIQVTEGTKYHVTKVLAIHDGTNVTFNEYGTLTTSTSLSTFALDVNSGNMRLLATPASTNSTVFKVKFTGIKV